jgi:hypothetical protein
MERAEKLPLRFREEMVTAILERWLELDRESGVNWIRAKRRDARCYEAWVKVAPDEALELMFGSNLSGRIDFASVVTAGLELLAGKDSRARVDLIMRYPPSEGRDQILLREIERWAATDPATAYSWALSLPEGTSRDSLELVALSELARVDPAEAMNRVKEKIPKLKPSQYDNGFVSGFADLFAAKDRALALEFTEALPDEFRKIPLLAVATTWAKSEPLEALAWGYERGVNLSEAFFSGGKWSSSVVSMSFAKQPKETVDFLLSLPDSKQRELSLQSLMHNNYLQGNAELGMTIFDGLSAERQFWLAPEFGRVIANSGNFPDMATWTSSFPDEAVRARAFAGAVVQVFAKSPERVDSIMSGTPEGPVRDQALLELVLQQSRSTPADAASRALEIRDEAVRFDALDQTMRDWMQRNRERAVDWLQTHDNIPRTWVREWLPNGS